MYQDDSQGSNPRVLIEGAARAAPSIFGLPISVRAMIETSYAILIGATFATLVGFYTIRHGQAMSRRQHTYDIYKDHREKEKFEADKKVLRELFASDRKLAVDDTDEPKETLDRMLGHYEFICAGIVLGHLDENLVREWEGGRIRRLWDASQAYIEEFREHLDHPTLFENIEFVVKRWYGENSPPRNYFYEFFWLRPYRGRNWRQNYGINMNNGSRCKCGD